MKRRFPELLMLTLIVALTFSSCKKATVPPVGLGSEATMSSPILKLGESWQGTMSGLIEVSVSYDTTTHTVSGTIKNISSGKLCWLLSEPHMKMGSKTVGELGPGMLGDLLPGEQVNTSLDVLTDPRYTGYQFDGYVLHMEAYDCTAGAPAPYPQY